jgi:hypothetical protein
MDESLLKMELNIDFFHPSLYIEMLTPMDFSLAISANASHACHSCPVTHTT